MQAILGLSGWETGIWAIPRSHPCWRLSLQDPLVEQPIRKESVRRHLNHYRRQGGAHLHRVIEAERWQDVRSVFFEHHTARQLRAGRAAPFQDPQKRAFLDALFAQAGASVHFTILTVAGRAIAQHYGFVWRDVLYWGAPAFDPLEQKHSPGQLLLALLCQHARESHLHSIDFTLGEEDFKRRFGNECVQLPSVDLYGQAPRFLLRKVRDRSVSTLKLLASAVASRAR